MRKARITGVDRASLITWPVAWALVYYAVTLSLVWGREVHPIQAMFLMFGMAITGLVAAAAAGIWLGFLARREHRSLAAPLTVRELSTFGAISGAAPMSAVVGLYELNYADSLGPAVILGVIASAGVAGALCSIATSGIVALRSRASLSANPRASTGTT